VVKKCLERYFVADFRFDALKYMQGRTRGDNVPPWRERNECPWRKMMSHIRIWTWKDTFQDLCMTAIRAVDVPNLEDAGNIGRDGTFGVKTRKLHPDEGSLVTYKT
jgi:hypothetical protein